VFALRVNGGGGLDGIIEYALMVVVFFFPFLMSFVNSVCGRRRTHFISAIQNRPV
jgi:hypothetical protein